MFPPPFRPSRSLQEAVNELHMAYDDWYFNPTKSNRQELDAYVYLIESQGWFEDYMEVAALYKYFVDGEQG